MKNQCGVLSKVQRWIFVVEYTHLPVSSNDWCRLFELRDGFDERSGGSEPKTPADGESEEV